MQVKVAGTIASLAFRTGQSCNEFKYIIKFLSYFTQIQILAMQTSYLVTSVGSGVASVHAGHYFKK